MATLDIITLAEAKRAINMDESATEHDLELGVTVSAISQLVDDYCGPVVARAVTETHLGGRGVVIPYQQPVLSMTTVTEYTATSPTVLAAEVFPGTVTSNDYALVDGKVYRRTSGFDGTFAGGRVVITYQAGRYADTASVGAKYKRAVYEILSGNWAKYAAAWARGGDPFTDPQFYDEITRVLQRWFPKDKADPVLA